MSYQSDKAWEESHREDVICLLGQIIKPSIRVASPESDRNLAVDFTIVKPGIACRLRRYLNSRGQVQSDLYPRQFTLRVRRDNGIKTELAKILEGCGDQLFYSHVNADDHLSTWWLIDLQAFRQQWSTLGVKMVEIDNRDGTYGRAFLIDSFPDPFSLVIAESHPLPKVLTTPSLFGPEDFITIPKPSGPSFDFRPKSVRDRS